jgi:hypothetical protein
VTKIDLIYYRFIIANYKRRRSPKNATITFFPNRTRSAIFQLPSPARSDKRQWDLIFGTFLFFCPTKEGGLGA